MILLMTSSVESAPQLFQPLVLFDDSDENLFIEQEEDQDEAREAPVQDHGCISGQITEECKTTSVSVEGTLDKLMATKIPQLYQPIHPHVVRIPFPTVHLIGQPIEYQQQIVQPTKVKIIKSSSFMAALLAHIRKFTGVFKIPHKTHVSVLPALPDVAPLHVLPPAPEIASVKITASIPSHPPVPVQPFPDITSVNVLPSIPSAPIVPVQPVGCCGPVTGVAQAPPPVSCCTSTSISSSTTCSCDPANADESVAEIKSEEEPSIPN